LIKIENLDFFYGENQVLDKINFSISDGEFVAIIGPNGAGKSTLLKIIDGIIPVSNDGVTLDELPVQHYLRRQIAQHISYLPQETEFPFSFKVEEVVYMGRFPYLKGIAYPGPEDEEIVQNAMELMDMAHFTARNFNELSGGEKQRVLIASALAQQPRVILLDEPTSALDMHHQIAIYHILKEQQQKKQLTVVVVTHDINLAAQFCDRMILMHHGKIINDGVPNKVLSFQTIQDIFGVKVYIDINPMTNSLYILPYE
jgi:iron complex transport system ATP-binding protein